MSTQITRSREAINGFDLCIDPTSAAVLKSATLGHLANRWRDGRSIAFEVLYLVSHEEVPRLVSGKGVARLCMLLTEYADESWREGVAILSSGDPEEQQATADRLREGELANKLAAELLDEVVRDSLGMPAF
jgi:hypothetical protein